MFSYPLLVLVLTFALLSLAAAWGTRRFHKLKEQIAAAPDEFGIVQGATLTLLGLLIGFSFSMAVGRYDQRKNLEEEEANAIGTEHLRADLLPAADAAKVRALLVRYTDERIAFYTTRDPADLAGIDARTGALQNELWTAVRGPATANPTPLSALAVAGMNDVLNSQGYTQAAWSNPIPPSAWTLMIAMGFSAALLLGIGAKGQGHPLRLLTVLPWVVSICFFLIADIDSPRNGTIRVAPQNLLTLKQSLRAP